jgi:hypothetical protein
MPVLKNILTQLVEKQQRRGIRFPTYTLSEAVRLAKAVQDQGGGRLSTSATAATLELSPTSSSFGSRVSAARHFGLIDESENILLTTELAKKILRPTNSDQEKEGLSEAFLNFHVFQQLLERFRNAQLPPRSILENILVMEYGISDVSKDVAHDVFVESGKFAGRITDTGKALAVENQETHMLERATEKTVQFASKLDEKLVQLSINIGALRTSLGFSSLPVEEVRPRIESLARDLLEKTLELAKELGLPATRMSLKVVSDRLNDSGLQDASRFASYLEEGLSDDLRSKESPRPE